MSSQPRSACSSHAGVARLRSRSCSFDGWWSRASVLVTPLATGVEATWAALLAGKSGVGPITRFEPGSLKTRIAAEVKDFDPSAGWIGGRSEGTIGTSTSPSPQRRWPFARAACGSGSKGPASILPERVGVIIGSGIGGLASAEAGHEKALRTGFDRLSPLFVLEILSNTAAGLVSIRLGARGPSYAPVAACSSGAHAIGEALWSIRTSRTDAVIAGAAEAAVTRLAIGGFEAMHALSARNEAPRKASRPFDAERDGFVLGEGAGILVLEEEEHARRRVPPHPGRGRRLRGQFRCPSPHPAHRGRCARCALHPGGPS